MSGIFPDPPLSPSPPPGPPEGERRGLTGALLDRLLCEQWDAGFTEGHDIGIREARAAVARELQEEAAGARRTATKDAKDHVRINILPHHLFDQIHQRIADLIDNVKTKRDREELERLSDQIARIEKGMDDWEK